MKNKSLYMYILIAVVALIIIVMGYIYNPYGNAGGSFVSSSKPEYRTSDLFTQIDSIKLDTSIFSDPRFSALTDITVAIINEPIGRTNPFATIR